MLRSLRSFFLQTDRQVEVQRIKLARTKFAKLNDREFERLVRRPAGRLDVIAMAAVVAARALGLEMFDVQLQGALGLTQGRVVEMLTGEGKTLVAVPAVIWYAKEGKGVHVMTVNDYLARRDAQWMGAIYRFFGLSVGYIQRNMNQADRRQAYSCDITYATANEVGFDYLRDQMALSAGEQVHRPFASAVIDEVDSILIDEARIPLVIAGGADRAETLANRVDNVVQHFRRGVHYFLDEYGRNVTLSDAGITEVEKLFRCGNLYAENNLVLLTAVQDSLQAHALLRRDVDYLVKNGSIESVDEFKGRIVEDRRWPAGLHTAVEAKEGVALKNQGRILGTITLENLVGLYPQVCGMTGTAATQADEFRTIYGLPVEVIPPHRPVIRIDHPDVIFPTRLEKEKAVIEEIERSHQAGQPVLVGTASVQESEGVSTQLRLRGIPHHVLNARNEEQEAAIIAGAGERGTVTISTNMAGRGTDIKLGDGVAELGGLYVIGTNKHESRRIDNQLRGRAGRQGDPGSSRFLISLEDDLLVRFGIEDPLFRQAPDAIQRVVEGQNLDIRRLLHKYEAVVEGQRQSVQRRRQAILTGERACSSELEKLVRLATIDDLWSDYLAGVADLRCGIQWVSWGGRDPLHAYLVKIDEMYQKLEQHITEESEKRLSDAKEGHYDPSQRGATWTYLTTDQPFGNLSERILKGLAKKVTGFNK